MRWFVAGMAGVLVGAGAAAAQPRPIVVELFTSQGCSSCPPADAIVAELARTRPDVLALTYHVTYWNRLGWIDPFSFEGATDRQREYASIGIAPELYTPEMVVDGTQDLVGSDREAVDSALARARRMASVDIQVVRRGGELLVSAGPSETAGAGRAALLLVGFDRQHLTPVGRGENSGRTLAEANVVRSLASLGIWSGMRMQVRVPLPAGEDFAVLLQSGDGRILGAARVPRPAS